MSECAPARFEQFYAMYPRRDAKKDAEKAWKQVKGEQHFVEIMTALEWQAPLLLERERHFRPLPASWLRGERWNDERPEAEVFVPSQHERRQFEMWRSAVGHISQGVTCADWVRRQRKGAA